MKERIKYIDIARAIAIFFIVFGHTIVHNGNCYWLYKIIYSFHVVLFFIISGFLYDGKKSNKEFICKKFKSLMIPYFVFASIFLVPYLIMGKAVSEGIGVYGSFDIIKLFKEIIMGVGCDNQLKQNTSLWFLPALFTMEVLFKLLDNKYVNRANEYVIGVIFIVISFCSTKINYVFPWGIRTAVELLPFFYMGILMKRKNLLEKVLNKKYSIIYIVLFIAALIGAEKNTTVSCANYSYGIYIIFLLTSVVFSITVFAISYFIEENKILEKVGRNTISILIFHKLFIIIFQTKINITAELLSTGNCILCIIVSIFIAIIAICVSMFIGMIIDKYMPFLYGKMKNTKL